MQLAACSFTVKEVQKVQKHFYIYYYKLMWINTYKSLVVTPCDQSSSELGIFFYSYHFPEYNRHIGYW